MERFILLYSSSVNRSLGAFTTGDIRRILLAFSGWACRKWRSLVSNYATLFAGRLTSLGNLYEMKLIREIPAFLVQGQIHANVGSLSSGVGPQRQLSGVTYWRGPSSLGVHPG